MHEDIKVPDLGESVSEAVLVRWYKTPGEEIRVDEPLCELETDKVTVEVPARVGGVLVDLAVEEGATVAPGAVLGRMDARSSGAGSFGASADSPKDAAPASSPGSAAPVASHDAAANDVADALDDMAPSVRRLMDERGVSPSAVVGSGKGGRITKADVLAHLARAPNAAPLAQGVAAVADSSALSPSAPPGAPSSPPVVMSGSPGSSRPVAGRIEERVRMSPLRRTVAARLKESQNTAAQLSTFNDVDMSAVMALRAQYGEAFEKRHGVRLGFMGLFVRACALALRETPAVNARIDGDDVVYHRYVDMGVAVATEKGLVVPVVRDVQDMGLAAVESAIGEVALKARDGRLAVADMRGGTFTISNGGVYGSLLSTPILNTPQSGILGMHGIRKTPVVSDDGEIVVRPMMYLALSYDHRIVDGREAVIFLASVKRSIEAPERMLLDV